MATIPTYYLDGLHRQPSAEAARIYLGVQDPAGPTLPPPATQDWPQSVTALADQRVDDVSISTPDNELFLPIGANGFFLVEMLLLYSGNSPQGDFAGRLVFPSLAGPGNAMGYWNGFDSNLNPVINAVQQGTDTIWPLNDVRVGVTSDITQFLICQVRFLIRTVQAGIMQFHFSNGQAGAGRIVIRRTGSLMRMQQLVQLATEPIQAGEAVQSREAVAVQQGGTTPKK
jgi:hypothetical protein